MDTCCLVFVVAYRVGCGGSQHFCILCMPFRGEPIALLFNLLDVITKTPLVADFLSGVCSVFCLDGVGDLR